MRHRQRRATGRTRLGFAHGVAAVTPPAAPPRPCSDPPPPLLRRESRGLRSGRPRRRLTLAASALAIAVGALTAIAGPASAQQAPSAPAGLTATAGDGSVTLAWDDPADSTITGYSYQVNHNDTSTGRFSGWGSWQDFSSSSSTTSHTITGLTNGREYRYRLRAANASGPGAAAPNGQPWYAAATPQAVSPPQPPATPTGLTAAAGVGDGAVRLTWSDPGDATITGYRYQVNHNATGTGKFSGWSSWLPIDGSDSSTTAHVLDGLRGGREYRYRLRAVNADGASRSAPGASPWYASATPTGQPPEAPPRIWVQRECDHLLKVVWERSPGKNVYDLDYSVGGGPWRRLMTDKNYNAWKATHWSKDRTYRFAVRAGNHHGESPWTISAKAPAPPCKPDTVQLVTHTTHSADAMSENPVEMSPISVSWPAGKRANAYDLNYSADGGASWTRRASSTPGRQHTVPASGARSEAVAVRSINTHRGITSPWQRADAAWLRATAIGGTTATLSLDNYSGGWWVKQTAPAEGTCVSGEADYSHAVAGLTQGTRHTLRAYSDAACAVEMAGVTFTALAADAPTAPQSVTVTRTDGALSVSWTQCDVSQASCNGGAAVSGFHIDLSSDGGTTWVRAETLTSYTSGTEVAVTDGINNAAYKVRVGAENAGGIGWSAIEDVDALAQFMHILTGTARTAGSAIGSISTAGRGTWLTNAFTTGPNPGGYILKSFTASLRLETAGAGMTMSLHAMEQSGSYDNSTSTPADTALVTLSGSAPTASSFTDTTFTCSGTGCELSPNTVYFVVGKRTGTTGKYGWAYSIALSQTNSPTGNGWNANKGHHLAQGSTDWATWSDYYVFRADFVEKPSPVALTATPAATSATLTLSNYPASWWLKRTTPASTACTAQTTVTPTVSSLVANTSYTYNAYSDSACSTEIASVTFTTPTS